MHRSCTPPVQRGNITIWDQCWGFLTRFAHLQVSQARTIYIRKNCRPEPHSQVNTLYFIFWTTSWTLTTSVYAFRLALTAPNSVSSLLFSLQLGFHGRVQGIQCRSELDNYGSRGHRHKESRELLLVQLHRIPCEWACVVKVNFFRPVARADQASKVPDFTVIQFSSSIFACRQS